MNFSFRTSSEFSRGKKISTAAEKSERKRSTPDVDINIKSIVAAATLRLSKVGTKN